MTRQVLATDRAPASPLYSQGVRCGSTIHVSGMVGMDVTTQALAGDTIQQQTRQALRNCGYVLEAGGATLDDVAQVTVLIANPADFDGMNEAYAEVFATDPPARAVARFGPEIPNVLVSVLMTAYVDD
jgi:2-iminobutanoate/2-iminopropanoate deaminase